MEKRDIPRSWHWEDGVDLNTGKFRGGGSFSRFDRTGVLIRSVSGEPTCALPTPAPRFAFRCLCGGFSGLGSNLLPSWRRGRGARTGNSSTTACNNGFFFSVGAFGWTIASPVSLFSTKQAISVSIFRRTLLLDECKSFGIQWEISTKNLS